MKAATMWQPFLLSVYSITTKIQTASDGLFNTRKKKEKILTLFLKKSLIFTPLTHFTVFLV